MTTLQIPSLDQRLLQTVFEEVEVNPLSTWEPSSLARVLNLLREMQRDVGVLHQELETLAVRGFEATGFVRDYGPALPRIEDYLERIKNLSEFLEQSPARADPAAQSFAVGLDGLLRQVQAYRDALAAALKTARQKFPPPADLEERLRAAEEAYARGELKRFRP